MKLVLGDGYKVKMKDPMLIYSGDTRNIGNGSMMTPADVERLFELYQTQNEAHPTSAPRVLRVYRPSTNGHEWPRVIIGLEGKAKE